MSILDVFVVSDFPYADVAQEREVEGELVLGDIGYGMPFRAGSFDGAIRYGTVKRVQKRETRNVR